MSPKYIIWRFGSISNLHYTCLLIHSFCKYISFCWHVDIWCGSPLPGSALFSLSQGHYLFWLIILWKIINDKFQLSFEKCLLTWHVSIPPSCLPAHIILLVICELPYALWHASWSTMGRDTCCRMSAVAPPAPVWFINKAMACLSKRQLLLQSNAFIVAILPHPILSYLFFE